MMVNLSFQKQVEKVFQKAGYLAMEHIAQKSVLNHKKAPFTVQQTVNIANQIYEKNRKSNFRFIEQGITPQQIAQQIEVHLSKGDFDWEIDQFGNFRVNPHGRFLEKVRALVESEGKYRYVNFEGCTWDQEVHEFDFYVHSLMTASDLCRMRDMEIKAKILEQYNGHRVIRNIYRLDDSSSTQTATSIVLEALFDGNSANIPIQPWSNLISNPLSGTSRKYIQCSRQNTTHIQTLLPHHTIINHSISNNQVLLTDFPFSVIKKLLVRPKIKEVKLPKLQTQELMILFGNFLELSCSELQRLEQVILLLKSKGVNCPQLMRTYQEITGDHGSESLQDSIQ